MKHIVTLMEAEIPNFNTILQENYLYKAITPQLIEEIKNRGVLYFSNIYPEFNTDFYIKVIHKDGNMGVTILPKNIELII